MTLSHKLECIWELNFVKNELITIAHVAKTPAVHLTCFISFLSQWNIVKVCLHHLKEHLLPLCLLLIFNPLAASKWQWELCFLAGLCLSREGVQGLVKRVLKQYMYKHHRENHWQRGKNKQINIHSLVFLLFGSKWKPVGATLHRTMLGLFSKRVMLLLCCLNPIKKGSETLIYCICSFTMNNGLVRESHYRKKQLSYNDWWFPGS